VEFSDRVGWILLGMVLGYVIRLLQEMKKEVHEVDEIVKRLEKRPRDRKRDERGFMANRYAADIAMILVFLMCLYATFSTGATNNKLEDAVADIKSGQKEDKQQRQRLARITVCTQDYLSQTIEALNERTEFTQAQADANVQLQKAQSEFLRIVLIRPPVSDEEADEALALYVSKLEAFVDVAGKSRDSVAGSEYPTPEQLNTCLNTYSDEEKAEKKEG
jgi:hypothetical protein